MKQCTILLLAALLLPAWGFARTQVPASRIIAQVNEGKAVQYSDAEIIGTLDFTSIRDTTADERREGIKGIFNGSTSTFWSHVRVRLKFSRCVFRGDVLAYVHDDDAEKTMNVIFYQDASFAGCEFQGKSHFKYAKFKGQADFKNTTYGSEALFKYAKFSVDSDFSAARFQDDANFKYVEFPATAVFTDAVFRREANFKYAEFPMAADFEKAGFQGEANFKYARFRAAAIFADAAFQRPANFKYAKFSQNPDFTGSDLTGSSDFKYAKVQGKPFTHDLLKNR